MSGRPLAFGPGGSCVGPLLARGQCCFRGVEGARGVASSMYKAHRNCRDIF